MKNVLSANEPTVVPAPPPALPAPVPAPAIVVGLRVRHWRDGQQRKTTDP